jgi:hypothetical protein
MTPPRAAYLCYSLLCVGALCGCASREADVGEQLRKIREEEMADRAAVQGPAEPMRQSTRERLESEVNRAARRLDKAEAGGDPKEIAAANNSLGRAQQSLALEIKRLQELEDLRARTPKKLIKIEGDAAATQPAGIVTSAAGAAANGGAASKPAEKLLPSGAAVAAPVATTESRTKDSTSVTSRAVESRPAESRPESQPADSIEAEYAKLTSRIRWLADLRHSGGDRTGAERVKRELARLANDYKTKDKVKAVEGLRKLEREADR